MKLSGNYNVGGEVAKEDERYKVVDNTALKGLENVLVSYKRMFNGDNVGKTLVKL